MAKTTKIRFNPTTREIEIEGTEQFVKKYFDIINNMFLESESSRPTQKTIQPNKEKKGNSKGARKRGELTSTVLSLITGSKEGITTEELKEKTGLTDRQIWAVIYRSEKEGKIKKVKRGIYSK